MAIQMRRGQLANYDKSKMLPGEWGISIDNDSDNQKAFISFAPGVSKEVMMVEDAEEQIAEATAEAIDMATEEAEAWAHGNSFHVNNYASGDGSTRTFTLAETPSSILGVYVNGASVSAYTLSGKTITFTTAPASGSNNIRVYYTVNTTTDNAKYYKEQAEAVAESIPEDYSELSDDVDQLKNAITKQIFFTLWEKGSFSADGSISSTSNATVSSLQKLGSLTTIRVIGDNARFIIAYYDSTKTYIGKIAADGTINKTAGTWKFFTANTKPSVYAPSEAVYFCIGCSPTDSTTITVETATSWSNNHFDLEVGAVPYLVNDVSTLQSQLALNTILTNYIRSKFVPKMSHNGSGSYESNTTRNAITNPLMFEFDITVNIASGFKYAIQYFDGYETGASHFIGASAGWQYGENIITAGSYFGMIVAYSNDSTADNAATNSLTFTAQATADDIYYRLFQLYDDYTKPKSLGDDYVITCLTKSPLLVSVVGQLSAMQAFCVYNGNYYSIDGSYLYEQDSSFNSISTTPMNTGHGNSLQLGNNGKAYASGWDDNTVYVVDLSTKTITETIVLPTTGYTICAIDDINKLAYIFQRDTLPDTEEYYNFIVYDYVNSEIISTKKTGVSFGAMQSCDFIEGKIFVVNGLHSLTVPNGYRVYNTDGDIIAEYILNTIDTEPEGISVNRKTKDLLISDANRKLYSITSKL